MSDPVISDAVWRAYREGVIRSDVQLDTSEREGAGLRAAITQYLAEQPIAALTDAQGRHRYLSTGCYHGEHDYCSAMTGQQGIKRPATCKFGGEPCICSCHVDQASGEPDGPHWASVREALGKLDGTMRARVALRTGIPVEELDELGGVGGDPGAPEAPPKDLQERTEEGDRLMDADEKEISDRADEIDTALAATGIKYEIDYEDDGGEGWHITISAGEDIPKNGGGCDAEFGLAFWTRNDGWVWGYVDERHYQSGPWPCRDLDAGATAAEVAEYVVDGLRRYGHAEDCAGCEL